MRVSILIAATAIGLMVFARIFMGVLTLLAGQVSIPGVVIPVAVALLILYGIVMGQRLAWQWGRLLGLLGGIILTLAAVGAFTNAEGDPTIMVAGALLALQGIPLFPMFFALGTQGAREHFRLTCPQCGAGKPKGGNFLFTEALCRKCGTRWR
jgi:hypothetical protein